MSFRIRPLTRADEPFLWQMLYQAIYVPAGQTAPPPAILQQPALARYVERWGQRPGDAGFLAQDAATDRPAGAAWLRLPGKENQGYGYVADDTPELSMALWAAYRGLGIGSQLLTHLLAAAAGAYPAISLSVSPKNPARRLYLRFGFRVVGQREGALLLRREL